MNNSTDPFGHQGDREQVAYEFKAVFYVAICVVALVSVIGNILEIITFVTTQNLRTSTNYYITSMAVSDLLFVAASGGRYTRSRYSASEESLSSFECKLSTYLSTVSYSVSIASLVLISVDRFVATVFPMKVTLITPRIRTAFILLTWVIPVVYVVPYLLFSRIAKEHEGPYLCANDMVRVVSTIYHTAGFVLLYLAPLIIITILNSRIMKSLRRTNPVIQGISQSNTRRRARNQRITKILISINVIFFMCWTPNYAIAFLVNSLKDFKESMLGMLVILCYYFPPFVSTAVNPVILFTFSSNYRQPLKDWLRLAVVKCRSCFKFEQTMGEENAEIPEPTTSAVTKISLIQSNLSNTDTEGAEQSVRIREVSVL